TDRPAKDRSFGKAKSCILLYLFGSPSQLETFDVKPDAPVAIRGQFGAIPSKAPEIAIGELLPQLATVLDRATIVRSLCHPYPIHGVAYALTSTPTLDIPMQLNPRDPRNWPFIGSVVDYLGGQKTGAITPDIPRNIALPWLLSSRRDNPARDAGPYGHF